MSDGGNYQNYSAFSNISGFASSELLPSGIGSIDVKQQSLFKMIIDAININQELGSGALSKQIGSNLGLNDKIEGPTAIRFHKVFDAGFGGR